MASPSPHITLSRYESYKAGTASLVRWLISTASACGYGDPKAVSQGPVPVKKLLKCASAIAEKRPAVHVPGHIVELAEDVIKGRQLYAARYAVEPAEQKKDGHAHFIEVLREVHGDLVATRRRFRAEQQAVFKSPSKRTATVEDEKDEIEKMQSPFRHLQVEEPAAQPFSTPMKAAVEEKVEQDEVATVELDEIEERKFALWCWLEDMLEIREYLSKVWADYADGKLSIDCATNTTEFAFHRIVSAEMELQDSFVEEGFRTNWMGVYTWLVKESMAEETTESDEALVKERLMCKNAFGIAGMMISELNSYADSQKAKRTYEPSETTVQLGRYHPFVRTLLGLVPALHMAGDPKDVLRSRLIQANGKYHNHLSLFMMLETYADVYDALGGQLDLVANELIHATERGLQSIQHCQLAWIAGGLHTGSVRDPEKLKDTLDRVKQEILPSQPASKGEASKTASAEATLLRALPVSTGKKLAFLKYETSVRTARMANDGLVITGLAYMYRAARQYDLLDSKWDDLEEFIRLQSRLRPYIIEVADHDSSPSAYLDHWRMGTFGTVDAANQRYRPGSMRTIGSQLELLADCDGEGCKEHHQCLAKASSSDSISLVHRIARKQYPEIAGDRFTSLQLIEAYKACFIRDEPEYNFPYLDFTADCLMLMREIRKVLYKLRPYMHEGDSDREDVTNNQFVKLVLSDLGVLKLAKRDLKYSALAMVAEVMKKHIKKGCDKYVEESRGKCSGSLAEERKPKLRSDEAHEEELLGEHQEPDQTGGESIGSAA